MSPDEFLKEFGHLAETEGGVEKIRALSLAVCIVADVPSVCIDDVADVVRGVSYPKSAVSEVPAEGFLPLLRANGIQRTLLLDDLIYVANTHVKDEQLLRTGDLLMAMSSGSKADGSPHSVVKFATA